MVYTANSPDGASTSMWIDRDGVLFVDLAVPLSQMHYNADLRDLTTAVITTQWTEDYTAAIVGGWSYLAEKGQESGTLSLAGHTVKLSYWPDLGGAAVSLSKAE